MECANAPVTLARMRRLTSQERSRIAAIAIVLLLLGIDATRYCGWIAGKHQTSKPVGRIGTSASRLGEADINVDYAYCGVDPSTNTPVIIFGVAEAGQAAVILDRTAAAA